MTMQTDARRERHFLRKSLPWVLAAVALVVYLLTVNHWISLANLNHVARWSGKVDSPELFSPLFFLVTYPIRWLPATWVPMALNLFSVVCAVLTLALLARSVVLLPHDRTEQQRQREHSRFSLLSLPNAWMPPALAVIVCGLQITFWEGATNGSSDMFDLLLLAYAVRNLLEYRVSQKDGWLFRAALVWGAGAANGWLLFCLAPAFLVALIWIKGLQFFDVRFLIRLFLFGLIGLLLLFLLPLIYISSPDATGGFWQALKANLVADKNVLAHFARQVPANVLLLLAMTSFLPLLVIGIRWASNFGDPSRMGSGLATWIFHAAHGALLLACVWIAFDPSFSPRNRGYAIPALYYLGALSVGYFSGYFLLVFKPLPDRIGRPAAMPPWVHTISQAAIWMLLILVPAGLLYRNLPQVRMTGGPAMKRYASLLVQGLPEKGVVLSDGDFPSKLLLAEMALGNRAKARDYLFVDTQLLEMPAYHGVLRKLYPSAWPAGVNPKSMERIGAQQLVNLMIGLSEKHPIHYLHPSFGYYFEYFYPQPHGLTWELKRYATNEFSPPKLTEEVIAENQQFWNANQDLIDRLVPFIAASPSDLTNNSLKHRLLRKLHLEFQPNITAIKLGEFYSRSLNDWGVQLQQAGKLAEARRHFQSAIALNADNLAAQANLDLNRDLQAGRIPELRLPRGQDDELGKYQSWQHLLRTTGPFDDPTHRFGLGVIFVQGGLLRQATHLFERVHAVLPEDLATRLWLAKLYVINKRPEDSLTMTHSLRRSPEKLAAVGIGSVDLLQTEVAALYTANRFAEGDEMTREALSRNPRDESLQATVVQISLVFNRYTNALIAVDTRLKNNPDDFAALVSKGRFHIELGQNEEAVAPLTRAINLNTNNHSARFFRAIALVNQEKYDEATSDLEALRKLFPNSVEVNNGFAEMAWRRKDTNSAIHYYELCLSNAIPGSSQFNFINSRLKDLKEPSPPPAPPPPDP